MGSKSEENEMKNPLYNKRIVANITKIVEQKLERELLPKINKNFFGSVSVEVSLRGGKVVRIENNTKETLTLEKVQKKACHL